MFRAVRAAERRDTFAATALLFAVLSGHAVLETARDALFLAKIPAAHLPWMYLGIAALSVFIVQLQARREGRGRRLSPQGGLQAWLFIAAGANAVLWALLDTLGMAGLYALYIWSGVMVTLVLVRFWLLLSSLFSVTQAKRLYGLIGTGAALGAISGSALAGALASLTDARHLLLLSAVILGLSAFLPRLLGAAQGPTSKASDAKSSTKPRSGGLIDDARFILSRPYARRLALLLALATFTLTVADYLFKDAVAREIAADDLGAFLATVYLILNTISLVVQLTLVNWSMRTFTVLGAMSALPLLLILGGTALAITGGLVGALMVKAPDGALRFSIHKTGLELLFVPMAGETRKRVKGFVDIVVQRGGQAVASVGILIAVSLEVDLRWFAVALAALALIWLLATIHLRPSYLGVFRGVLSRTRRIAYSDIPSLDLASFETLIGALDSVRDDEVLAALDILNREGRAHLVPALILYHPSERVVLAALELFTRDRRENISRAVDHLLESQSPTIRAAAYATRSVIRPDERALRMALSMDDSDEVRATLMVNLIAMGAILGSDAADAVNAVVQHGRPAAQIALCDAVRRRRAPGFEDALETLATGKDSEVCRAALEAMGALEDPRFLPTTIYLLGNDAVQSLALDVLHAHGEVGVGALADALASGAYPPLVRHRMPRALATVDPTAAARILPTTVHTSADALLRYRAMRALERLQRAAPTLQIDKAVIMAAVEQTVGRAFRYLDRSLIATRSAKADPTLSTDVHGLLLRALAGEYDIAIDRILRLIGLLHPGEDFETIVRGFDRGDPEIRASATELLDNLLSGVLRAAVLGLLDDLPAEERLLLGRRYHAPLTLDYEGLITSLLDSESSTLRAIAVHHIGELQWAQHQATLEGLRHDNAVAGEAAWSLRRLVPQEGATHAP